ncbi:GAF domain-containing protein [Candidatus Leptofilum sp.]|uniref:GAF domain-containing protein n=1 Tax=Candidatus Leptofilum sp. TaxID=3241576 RepID=UPI003B5B60CD
MSVDHTQTVLSALTQPVVIARVTDGHLLFANDAFSRLIGVSREQLIGKSSLSQSIGSADYQKILRQIETEDTVHELEMEIARQDKEKISVMLSCRSITYDDTPAILISMVDTTSRRENERLLEQRAREMEAVSQVSTFASSILDTDKLLQTMVDLTQDRFGLYHAHVYLLNKRQNMLNLAAGSGEVGRRMVDAKQAIPLATEQSLVAMAARTRQGVIENDVRANPTFLPNALLPNTKAEMAVPMMVGEVLLGVLDVQSDELDYFNQESIHIYTTLAAQLGVAIQNARSFGRAQKSLTETRALLQITNETGNLLEVDKMLTSVLNQVLATTKFEAGLVSIYNPQRDDLDLLVNELPQMMFESIQEGGLKGSLCDLVYRGQKPIVVTDLMQEAPVDVTGLVNLGYQSYQGVPLRSGDEVLGTLCIFCSESLTLEEANTDFLLAVGQQVGAAIRNAQAFERSQAALADAKLSQEALELRTRELDELTRRLTREGWEDFLENEPDEDLRFLFDGESIHGAENLSEETAVSLDADAPIVQPIAVRGVPIGKMAIVPEEDTGEVEEVVGAVMQQLAAHIENLRLTDQVQSALAQTESLYTGSERIVLSSTEADVLDALINSTQLRTLDRANIFLFDQPVEDGVPRDVAVAAIWENEGVPRMVAVGTRFAVEQVPFMNLLTPDQAMIISDIREDDRIDPATQQILEGFGMMSFVLFPMVVGSQWLGIVSGQSSRPLHMNEVQRRQTSSLVNQAAVVLQTTILFRQEQARAHREQLLREITTKVRSSVDVDTVMRTAVMEIGRSLGRRAFIELGGNRVENSQDLSGAS